MTPCSLSETNVLEEHVTSTYGHPSIVQKKATGSSITYLSVNLQGVPFEMALVLTSTIKILRQIFVQTLHT